MLEFVTATCGLQVVRACNWACMQETVLFRHAEQMQWC